MSLPSSRTDRVRLHASGRAPYAVLFVCTGNIARSASAEILARMHSPQDSSLVFASAGTAAVVGSGVAPDVDSELELRGARIERHRAQQLTRHMVDGADLVLAMEPHHRAWILDEWPVAAQKTHLLKHVAMHLPQAPVSGTESDPAQWMRRNAPLPRDSDAVKDPFGKGRDAARAAVAQIEEALGTLVPKLETWAQHRR